MIANSWNSPITVEDPQTGSRRTVKTVRQAKDMLEGAWAAYRGSQYRRAKKACNEVLDGRSAPITARQAFIAAAVEAHLRLS